MTKISQLPKYSRPREKLSIFGPSNLTEIELIALILGSGSQTANVLTQAKQLLKRFGSLTNLSQAKISTLTKQKGIGQIQAGKLIASLELANRLYCSQQLPLITKPQTVIQQVSEITHKRQEYLLALYLNARHQLINKQTLAIGSLNQLVLEPREVFALALQLPCSEIILVHNHPSGDPTPSPDDLKFTTRILKAGQLLGINLIDHLIVAQEKYSSMRELDLLNNLS